MAELVSKIYSQALFEVALENDKLDEFVEEMNLIASSCKDYPKFYEILKTPKINVKEKKKVVSQIFKGKISQELINFLKIILDKRRIKNLFSIQKEFENMVLSHKGIVKAKAITTIPLDEKQIEKLKKKLSEITKKNIQIENEIDEKLIGGILIKLGDKVIDGTIKNKLKELQNSLTQITV